MEHLTVKPIGKRPLVKSWSRWKDNIKFCANQVYYTAWNVTLNRLPVKASCEYGCEFRLHKLRGLPWLSVCKCVFCCIMLGVCLLAIPRFSCLPFVFNKITLVKACLLYMVFPIVVTGRSGVVLVQNGNVPLYLKFRSCVGWVTMKFQSYFYIEWFQQGRQCTYKRNIEARSRNNCCQGKAVSRILSVCL